MCDVMWFFDLDLDFDIGGGRGRGRRIWMANSGGFELMRDEG